MTQPGPSAHPGGSDAVGAVGGTAGGTGGDSSGGLVQWRRRGSAAELQFAVPARSKTWRTHWFPAAALPWVTSVGWWFMGAAAHATATVGAAIGFAAGGLELAPVWIGSLIGLVVPPAAGVAGYVNGRKRQAESEQRTRAIEGIDRAALEALGTDVRGFGGKSLSQKVADAMRRGTPQRARVLSTGGYVEYRIEPVDATTVSISPLESTPEAATFNQFVRSVGPAVTSLGGGRGGGGRGGSNGKAGRGRGVTAEVDARMRTLEDRLGAIERIGQIDKNHPSYPQFVILQVDRLTEYRHLASRAQAVSRVESPEARETTRELVDDLERIVDLVQVGVDALEREVLDASKRESDAHLGFLRDKYAR